jgi:hypothetical protein
MEGRKEEEKRPLLEVREIVMVALLASIGFKEISLAWGEITLRQYLWTLSAVADVVLIHALRFHLLVGEHAPGTAAPRNT